MSATLVYILLALALVLPLPAALLVRVLSDRLGERGTISAVALVFAVAIASVLTLSRADVGVLRVGDLTLLLPGTSASDFQLPADIPINDAPPDLLPTPVIPTLTPRPSVTPTPSATATATPEPSATPEPTAEPTPEPTPEPPTPAPQAGPQTYTVQAGDTLRGIAERFGVSVEAILEASGLSAADGDNLRVGQELTIPSP